MEEIVSTLLVDLAYKLIIDDAYHKKLIPGQKIMVRELSERYNISVTPIKQALNRLVSEGIVETIPRRGMILRSLSVKDIQDTVQVRLLIEQYSVPFSIACAQNNPAFLEQLEENLSILEKTISEAFDTDYYVHMVNVDFDFHKMLVASTGNEKLYEIYDSLGTHCMITYLYGKKEISRAKASLEEHRRIFNALKSGSPSELSAAVSDHIDQVRKEYELNVSEYLY